MYICIFSENLTKQVMFRKFRFAIEITKNNLFNVIFLPSLSFIWSNIFRYSESLGNFGANHCFGFPFQIPKKC